MLSMFTYKHVGAIHPLVKSHDQFGRMSALILSQEGTSTFPLYKGSILHHAKLVPEVYELCPRQRLGQKIRYLLICRNILELYNSSVDHLSDEAISHLNVIRLVMEYRMHRKLDTTFIITVSQGRLKLTIK